MEASVVLAGTAWLRQNLSTQYRGTKSSNKTNNYMTTLSCTIWHMHNHLMISVKHAVESPVF